MNHSQPYTALARNREGCPGKGAEAGVSWKDRPKASRCGFTLVEVVLALGVFSFGIVGIIGLLPIGLQTTMNAKVATVRAQIQQRLASEVLLTDYSALPALSGSNRYFNEEGLELTGSNTSSSIYTAETVVTTVKLPSSSSGSGNYAAGSASDVTFFVIQDPGHHGITPTTQPTGSVLVAQSGPVSQQSN